MTYARNHVTLYLGILALSFLIGTGNAHAYSANYARATDAGSVGTLSGVSKSVLWSNVIPVDLCNHCHYGRLYVQKPSVSVQYGVSVTRASTGAVIASGESIPVGEAVRFRFKPHVYSDIYWFGTGYFLSSPYGDWVSAAQLGANAPDVIPAEVAPSRNRLCSTKNVITVPDPQFKVAAYGSFAVNSPVKRIDNLASYNCTPIAPSSSNFSGTVGPIDGGGLECVFSTPGQVNPTFVFEAVSAHFFLEGSKGAPGSDGTCAHVGSSFANVTYPGAARERGGQTKYTVTVPQQSIPFSLTITPDPTGTAPAKPVISTVGACMIGVPYAINFSATDPDSHTLRYGIDWNNDSVVDQWVPPTGYVPSGTQQSASRTFASVGSKTVNIRAQDQLGLNSEWSNVSFSCANNPDLPSEVIASLNEEPLVSPGDFAGNNTGSAAPDLTLRAVPSLVRSGDTTIVNWSATNVSSCTVQGTNGDSWDGVTSPVGGEASRPIIGQVKYTLTCLTDSGVHKKDAIVNILPTWKEL